MGALRFENEKLRREVEEIRRTWNEESHRTAALHFRVACLLEDKRKLELNVAGARGLSEGWEPVVQALRDEIRRLQGRLAEVQQGERRAAGPVE